MHKLLPILLLLLPLAADVCVAQTSPLNIVCADCRDANQYPDDFVNFAFNQAYGPDAWLTFEQADDFFITNLDNQTVYVDIDFVFLGFGIFGLELPYWPTNLLQFTVALPNGNIYTVLRTIHLTSLPVPSSNDGGEGESGGGDEGDDVDEDDGFVEDGHPDDSEWCEEC